MRGVHCDGSAIQSPRRPRPPNRRPRERSRLRGQRLVGICDTDLQLAKGYMGFRGILGHEFVGSDRLEGRRGSRPRSTTHASPAQPASPALTNHCPNRTVLGILGHDGAMADRVCVPRAATSTRSPTRSRIGEARFSSSRSPPRSACPSRCSIGPSTRLTGGRRRQAWESSAPGSPGSSGPDVSLVGKHPEKLKLWRARGSGRSCWPIAGSIARTQDVVS